MQTPPSPLCFHDPRLMPSWRCCWSPRFNSLTGPAGGDTCAKHDLSAAPVNWLNPPADCLLVLWTSARVHFCTWVMDARTHTCTHASLEQISTSPYLCQPSWQDNSDNSSARSRKHGRWNGAWRAHNCCPAPQQYSKRVFILFSTRLAAAGGCSLPKERANLNPLCLKRTERSWLDRKQMTFVSRLLI